jgi:hypothetical protein
MHSDGLSTASQGSQHGIALFGIPEWKNVYPDSTDWRKPLEISILVVSASDFVVSLNSRQLLNASERVRTQSRSSHAHTVDSDALLPLGSRPVHGERPFELRHSQLSLKVGERQSICSNSTFTHSVYVENVAISVK